VPEFDAEGMGEPGTREGCPYGLESSAAKKNNLYGVILSIAKDLKERFFTSFGMTMKSKFSF